MPTSFGARWSKTPLAVDGVRRLILPRCHARTITITATFSLPRRPLAIGGPGPPYKAKHYRPFAPIALCNPPPASKNVN